MNDDSLSMKFFKLLNTVATHLIPYSVIFHNTIYPISFFLLMRQDIN